MLQLFFEAPNLPLSPAMDGGAVVVTQFAALHRVSNVAPLGGGSLNILNARAGDSRMRFCILSAAMYCHSLQESPGFTAAIML